MDRDKAARRRLTAFCTHTSSDAFVIRKPGGRAEAARHEIALPLITDPCTDKQADNNATDALWTQTARVQSRTTSTSLYIRNVLTCRYATWLDEELLASTGSYGLWGTHNPPVVGSSPTRPTWSELRRCPLIRPL